jgi:hypothetical protein
MDNPTETPQSNYKGWTMSQYDAGLHCIVRDENGKFVLVPFKNAPPEAQKRSLSALVRGTRA